MGLTLQSSGIKSIDYGMMIQKKSEDERVVALAGNPNVGKSTVFNALTGMKQHTGNWPGKTVANAQGKCRFNGKDYIMVDIPGTYSLTAHSTEEKVARDFICFGNPDAVVVVCDATCLERNLSLALQTMEITKNVVVCVNLMDEARKKHIKIDLKKLERTLGVPVAGINARSRKGLDDLMKKIDEVLSCRKIPLKVHYSEEIEKAVSIAEPVVREKLNGKLDSRWVALKLLERDEQLINSISDFIGFKLDENEAVAKKVEEANEYLKKSGYTNNCFRDMVVSGVVGTAEAASRSAVTFEHKNYNEKDRKIDSVLTSKWGGFPIMLLLLTLVFWLTLVGANYPSELLSDLFFKFQNTLVDLFAKAGAPWWLTGALILGVYRVLAWVVSVMLPPMAIFFPLFTLLEDLGYLPRVAFNLDKYFKKARACGKQALTMCMGFGCNAAGIVGCRIIDSPRERLIAIITNNFVPCNGRFPTLIAIISMFFVGAAGGMFHSLLSTLILTGVIVLGVAMTFWISRLLSSTLLKGVPSSFTLELPPYRRPQIAKVIVRSIFDRTLFVLGRAVVVAAPAGLIIWLLANIRYGGVTLLSDCSSFLDPFARLLGLDGVILFAFILGFPANEIVVPIIIMAYMATGNIMDLSSLGELKVLLVSNGWSWLTAVCAMLFSLMHWPCSTTCLTIYKETHSLKWTAVSFAVPTVVGMAVCFLFAGTVRLLGLA